MSSESGDRGKPAAELARRLREEVRDEAQREADAIISRARQDIKEIVSGAYAELLVLRAQVQAISDEKVDSTLPPSMQTLEAEAQQLRRQLGHSGVEEDLVPRPALPAAAPEPPRVHHYGDPPPFDSPPSAPRVERPFGSSFATTPRRRLPPIVPIAAGLAILSALALLFWSRGGADAPAPSGPTAAPSAAEPSAPPAATAPAPAPDAAPPAPAYPAGTVTLEMRAARNVWVRAEVDGEADNGRIYTEGQTWRIGPAGSIALRVGDGGAVTVSLNGAEPMVVGADGVVVNRRYGEAAGAPAAPADAPPVAVPPAEAPSPSAQRPPPSASAPAAVRPQSPAAPPAPASAPSTPAATAAPSADPAQQLDAEIRALDRRWFEATYRGDDALLRSLRADSFEVNDSRGPRTRPAPGVAGVQRRLGRVGVTMVGENAVLAGRMVEEMPGGETFESLFSEIWVRSGGDWRLAELRIQPATPDQAQP